jgi:riboflavin kinase/FMN adenylyltransferase
MVLLNGIKNIIFDFGGVLVDLQPELSLESFARLGMPQVADYLTPYGHKGPFGELENGQITESEFYQKLRDLFRVQVDDASLQSAWADFLLHTPVNKMKMVYELAKTHRVFLLSNTNPIHIRKLEEFDKAGFPVKVCFEKLYLSYEIGLSKPGKEIFSYVLRDAGIKPEETLFIDDGPANCQTAAEMGFRTLQPAAFEDFTGDLLQPDACVATMGFFDGIHLGHRYLIESTQKIAQEKGLPTMVISFWPHPRTVLDTNFCPQLLSDDTEKRQLLRTTNIDHVRTITFNKDLAALSAFDFMKEILKKELHVSTLVIGYDHKFGNNRLEGFAEYQAYGKQLGMEVIMAKPLKLPDALQTERDVTISSSFIRRAIAAGKMDVAKQLLGRYYHLTAKVVGGHRIGRRLGFPTANLEPISESKLIPAIGVYAVWVWIGKSYYKGMLYIGKRPTLQQDLHPVIEVNLLDFEGDLYGKILEVAFVERTRGDETFPDLDALVCQLEKDRATVRKLLKKP